MSNLPSIDIETFSKIVELQISEGNYRPIFGLGKGGIGKTESIKSLAVDKLKIGYIDIRLLLYNEVDLKGIPYPNSDNTKTVFLQNNVLPNEVRDGARGILVLDEITSCAKSVRTAAYQLLNERKLGEYILPEQWLIVCLGNGEDDGGDYQGMEGNFANRCSVFNVVCSVDSWKRWALRNNVNSLVVGYVSFKPSDLHSFNPDSDSELLFASPRSWKAVSDILNKQEFNENDSVLSARIVGNLGTLVGRHFVAFCKLKNKAIDPMDIVNGNVKSDFDYNKNNEVLLITIQSVVKIMANKIKGDYESFQAITQDCIEWLSNGLRWILSLKCEYAVMGFKDLISYDNDLIPKVMINPDLHKKCPEIIEFAKKNKEVFV